MMLALVITSGPLAAQTQANFSNPDSYPVGDGPSGVAIGDVNGDGDLDLVTSNSGTNSVSVALGNRQGGFGPRTDYPTNGDVPTAVALADFDNDGSLDIAATNHGTNNVSVLLNNGSGNFGPTSTFAVGQTPFGVTTGASTSTATPTSPLPTSSGA